MIGLQGQILKETNNNNKKKLPGNPLLVLDPSG